MTRLLRPLAATAASLGLAASAVTLGGNALPAASADAKPTDPKAPPGPPAPSAKPADPKVAFAVEPKPLSDATKKGLKFLADAQQKDGGWAQGGGWRTGGNRGGRVEGKDVADPSDVGNTCVTLLALVRAGNTPTEGEYKEHVKKGLKFVCERVEKADAKDLYVTDVRDTQLQSKIGPYTDTFLATLVLSELKGKGGDDEKRLVACLDKTVDKIAKNQKDDGTFANNGGWAPTLSMGVCNKALSRARLNGAKVGDEVLARAAKQSGEALKGGGAGAAPGLGGRGKFGEVGAARGDAGVELYSTSQGAGNLQDVLNTVKVDADKARQVVADPNAKPEDKKVAARKVEEADKLAKQAADARTAVAGKVRDQRFVAGFGNNGGEEFLSFLNISEMLVLRGDKTWKEWDGKMQESIAKAQDKDGGWSGHHCITGRTFCTAAAVLVMLADRTPFPEDVIKAARDEAKKDGANKDEPKTDDKK